MFVFGVLAAVAVLHQLWGRCMTRCCTTNPRLLIRLRIKARVRTSTLLLKRIIASFVPASECYITCQSATSSYRGAALARWLPVFFGQTHRSEERVFTTPSLPRALSAKSSGNQPTYGNLLVCTSGCKSKQTRGRCFPHGTAVPYLKWLDRLGNPPCRRLGICKRTSLAEALAQFLNHPFLS